MNLLEESWMSFEKYGYYVKFEINQKFVWSSLYKVNPENIIGIIGEKNQQSKSGLQQPRMVFSPLVQWVLAFSKEWKV